MTMFDFTSWLRQAFPRSQPTGKRDARRKTTQPPVLEQLEDRTVPSITWQVQSDYFGVNTGSESQPRSLRGLALTADGQNIYGGFIQGTVSAAIRQVSSVVNSSLIGNDGGSPTNSYGSNPPYTTGLEAKVTTFFQAKGLATDNRGYVYATLSNGSNTTSQEWAIYNSSLTQQVALETSTDFIAPRTLSGIATAELGGHYYVYIGWQNGQIERWNVDNPADPILDTSWGSAAHPGTISLKTINANAYLDGLTVDANGDIYVAGGLLSTTSFGDSLIKIPAAAAASGNLASATSVTVGGGADGLGGDAAMNVALFNGQAYVTEYLAGDSTIAVFNTSDLSSAGIITPSNPTGPSGLNATFPTGSDSGFSGIDISASGQIYVAEQLYNTSTNYTPPGGTPMTGATVDFDRIMVSSALPVVLTGSSAATATGGVEDVTAATLGNATFTDANPGALLTDFTVTAVTWGDGSTDTTGLTVSGSGGSYMVNGSHLYGEESAPGTPYDFSITVTGPGGSTAVITGTATVTDAALTAGTVTASGGVEGVTVTSLTATFTDANTGAPTSDFSGTINWGDGNPATSFTSADVTGSGGSYTITSSYQYAEESVATPYSITVTINDVGGSSTTDTGSTTVTDAALSSTAADLTPPAVTAAGGSISNQVLLHFTDADPSGTAADYTATVTWGDGTSNTSADGSGTVSVVAHAGGGFDVQGSHTYALAFSNASFGVSVADHNATTSQSTTISVAPTYPLVAEFSGSGVWRYVSTGAAATTHWQQLTPSDATLTAIDASGDVVAEFSIARYGSHGGVWRYQDATGWVQLTAATLNPAAPALVLGIDGSGHVFADFKGYGLDEYVSGTTWTSVQPAGVPTSVDATLLAVGANGDAAAAFSGYGVWRHLAANPPTNWLRLTAPGTEDASLLAMDASDHVFADFMGYGLDEYVSGTTWMSVQPAGVPMSVDATLLAVGANGDAAAAFPGYGVWRHLAANPPTNWLQLTAPGTEDASLLALDGHGDLFADFMHYGVDAYLSGTSWMSIQPPELQPPDVPTTVDAALLAAAPV